MAIRKVNQGGVSVASKNTAATNKVQRGKVIYRLADGSQPERYILKTSNHIGFDDDGQQRFMRLSQMSSKIWLEDQPDNITIQGLQFIYGELVLDPTLDRMAIEFMKRSSNNVTNGGTLFKLYNPIESAEAVVSKEERIIEAKSLIMGKFRTPEGLKEITAVSLALNIGTGNEDEKILKQALYAFADRNPIRLIEAFDDKAIKALALVYAAEEKKEIVYDGSSVKFAGGLEILKVPQGRKWKEFLAEYLTEPKNIDLLKEFDVIANTEKKSSRKL